jgi:hypothetical protein
MATVNLTWTASPAEEQVSAYNVYVDTAPFAAVQTPNATIPNIGAGAHSFAVAAVNVWGEGPLSDAVMTPPACGKIQNLNIQIVIHV